MSPGSTAHQVIFECECSRLGLAEEVDRQEPQAQRQLGALRYRADDQGG